MNEEDALHELTYYTLAHGDPAFIHQYVVDAYMAQHADDETKPIGITFALVGLYLHVERQVSGRDVQRAHMRLGQRKQTWPTFTLPADRGAMRVTDVIAKPPGSERDRAIDEWCVSVWSAFRDQQSIVVELLRQYGYS